MSPAASQSAAADDVRLGVIASGAAYVMWGVLPLYLKQLAFASAFEVLAVRIVCTVPAALAAVLLIGGWRQTWDALQQKGLLPTLAMSSAFIGINWAAYVWAVVNAHVIEASLAYFLAPLVGAAIGVAFFGEKLGRWQIAALALAGIGVALLVASGLTATTSQAPAVWVTFLICASWTLYAVIRKRAAVPAAGGLLMETVLLSPLAIGWLFWTLASGASLAVTQSAANAVWLAVAGPITAIPLILFTLGARRLRFSTLGLLQYIGPTLQFAIGVAYGEPFGYVQAASFVLIWIGLAAFTYDTLRRERTQRD